MKHLYHYLFIAALIASADAKSQDIHFSQIFETPILRNPSLAGIFSGDYRIQSVYRSQWNSVTVPYETTSLSGEFRKQIGSGDDYLTIGGQILYDKAGTVALTSTHVLPALNYHKSLSQEKNIYLSVGFMGGWVQRRLDRSKMTTNNQFDGTNYNSSMNDGERLLVPSYGYFDGSAGMSVNAQLGENPDNNMFFGVAYHHFNKSRNISFYSANDLEMTPKWVVSGGLRTSMTSTSYFTVQADLSKQGTYTEWIGGALYSWKLDESENPKYFFHAGAYLRWKDAIIPVAKIEFKPFAVAMSYDANTSQLTQASRGRGGFEVSVTYQNYSSNNRGGIDQYRCPKF
jgi:type IX secretion system PorP/SprF family membrane protein